jgi:predicted nucleic acid-binding protein
MYLIDSSAWIEYLRLNGSPKVKQRVREILQMDAGACCGIVAVEILRGAKNEKDFQSLRDALISLEQLPIDGEVIERAARWGYLLDRKGKPIPTTDLVIASSAYGKARLIHIESDYEMLSPIVGLEEEKLVR